MKQYACSEMTFRCSAKSYNVKTCFQAQSLLRQYKSRLFSNFLLPGFDTYHRLFFTFQRKHSTLLVFQYLCHFCV